MGFLGIFRHKSSYFRNLSSVFLTSGSTNLTILTKRPIIYLMSSLRPEIKKVFSRRAPRLIFAIGAAGLYLSTLTGNAEAQTNCPTGVVLADQLSGRFELGRLADPNVPMGARVSLSDVVKGDGRSPIRIELKVLDNITILPDGSRGVRGVQIYDHDSYQKPEYIRVPGSDTPYSLDLKCGNYTVLRMNRQQVGNTAAPVAPVNRGIPGVNPDNQVVVTATPTETPVVVTATPTATARVETPTPTVTPVIHTPTSTETPFVVTATPTETPFVVTATPALPPTVGSNRGIWDGLGCAGLAGGIVLAASLIYAARRG